MLAQIILGPSSLIQASLPYILEHTGNDFYQSLNTTLENQANACIALLKSVPGLRPVAPQGAMYVMVEVLIDQFHDIKDDVDFCKKLLEAENVMVLPGQAFNAPNFFRIVICAPHPVLTEAFERIQEFCQRNLKNKKARTN
jgi:tyrosine aminotransferase